MLNNELKHFLQHLQTAGARIGADLKIFSSVAQSEKPLTTSELAQLSGAAPELMGMYFRLSLRNPANNFQGRILRYLASVGMVKEESKDAYSANNITKVLADPNYQAGIYHWHATLPPLYRSLNLTVI